MVTRWMRAAATAAVLLCAGASSAAVEGPGRTQFIQAARASGAMRVDGKLDEAAWATAPVFSDFKQRFPTAGKAPSERTELRVLYDDQNLYVGVTAYDSEPAKIDRRLGRRDSFPMTDAVQVMIDPTHDHRTAYMFYLSAGGVQGDGMFFDDRSFTTDWNAVWAGAAGSAPDGWVAEYAIPLSILRFPDVDVQTWGFGMRRDVSRKNEEIDSVTNPRTSNANVSRMGHLTGLKALEPHRRTELVPYLATRSVARPQYSDASRPTPRLMEPSLDVGLDLRTTLSSDLSLKAAFNPDFGELEADQLVLNLSTFENFFPEKRTFFTEGLELFQPVASGMFDVPHRLFYSRRIGLGTPILGAAKMTGTLAHGTQVSVLDALVMGPWQRAADEDRPDGSWRMYGQRPLHLGPNSALPTDPQVPTNYLAAVVRSEVGPNARVGGTVTSALPLERGCTAEQAALDEELQPVSCFGRGGNAAALDLNLTSDNGEYGLMGQVSGSQVTAGLPERTLRDGTVLARGATGAGAFVRAGKFGGEGFRWDVGYDYSSPTLDLNASGFQRTQNEQVARGALRYQRGNGWGPLKSGNLQWVVNSRYTTDGRAVHRGTNTELNAILQLPSFDFVGGGVGGELGGYTVRELDTSGVPLQNANRAYTFGFVETNQNRPVFGNLFAVLGRTVGVAPTPSAWGWTVDGGVTARPHASLETRLEATWDRTSWPARYADTLDDTNTRFLLGSLQSNFLSLTLRQSWILSPRLTVQAYAQLFTDYGAYDHFFEGVSQGDRGPIRLASLTPTTADARDYNFHDTSLNLNAVVRWEYRLGSTLFLVYSHAQQGMPVPDGALAYRTLAPRALLRGPGTDAVMVKWSYFWDI